MKAINETFFEIGLNDAKDFYTNKKPVSLFAVGEGAQQCMAIQGRVRCGLGPTPAQQSPIFVTLIDVDEGRPDDLMDKGYASRDSGSFQLYGCASDPIGDIDPELRVYHKCRGREIMDKFVIPTQAIGKEYNFTEIINLQATFSTQTEKTYPVPKCSSLEPTTKKPPKI
uniref:Transthyretin-like family protein n=1 Tax=Romanomermis culicivorax TaxID=13658 RepID=A0A915JUL2_ROMCU